MSATITKLKIPAVAEFPVPAFETAFPTETDRIRRTERPYAER